MKNANHPLEHYPNYQSLTPPMIRLLNEYKRRERRCEREPLKSDRLNIEAAVVIADGNVKLDLDRLIPTFMLWGPPGAPLYLVGDAEACEHATIVAEGVGCRQRLKLREWVTDESRREANERLSNLTNQSDYWKPDMIWWKLEGLRRVVEEVDGGVLLLDSDIVFTAPFVETEFEGVDAVVSPFYWLDPEFPVRPHREGTSFVPIANRDGHINAGFILVNRADYVEDWLKFYEMGIGGFYEQWIMKFMASKYRTGYFSWLHNWGSWRREHPNVNVRSLHIHKVTEPKTDWHKAIQDASEAATEKAIEILTQNK